MMLPVTGLFAGSLAALFLLLTVRVIAFRRQNGISLGDGSSDDLLRRIRAHGNFAEYVPFSLVLLAVAEMNGRPGWSLHAMGAVLLAGRLLHGLNFSFGLKSPAMRVGGMVLTLCAIAFGAVLALPI